MIRPLRSASPSPRRCLTVAAVALATVLGAMPAWGQSDPRDLANRLQRLENEVQTLNREVYRGGARPPAVGGAAPVMGGNVAADFEVRLQRLESEMQTLTGRYEEATFQVAQLREQLAKMQQDLEFRLARLEQGQAGGLTAAAPTPGAEPAPAADTASKPAAAPVAAATPPAPTNLPSGTVQEQYDLAFNLLREAQYERAETAFSAFIQANAASSLASNAQYWLGETYYVRGKYKEAAVAFAEGYQKYPKSQKAPDALLKLSLSLSAMKSNEDACAALTELNRAYRATAPQTILRRAEAERNRLKCK
ncbi:tol-pal system protein YbgF [Niveispirillum lacus]|uniref:Cell division coordinator CpoB n=1 Tax=Niveispirillum lacus TaxID=1981099 RepID=A0A255YW34_9PROT|nr:tol-pal system protein YbgF [Niveispirillum lacus]OYQ32630.1 tol-pal system protein YbgF [Niveispirillum lacus]